MKIYPILETELRSVSMLNTLVTAFASLGFGSLTFGAGIIIDVLVEGGPIDAINRSLMYGVAPIFGVLALVFGAIALWAWNYRRSEFQRILQESETVVDGN